MKGEANMKMGEFELNKIYCMDCLEGMKKLPDNSADLMILDPPYFKVADEAWDNQWSNIRDYLKWLEIILIECKRILKRTGTIYVYGMLPTIRQIADLMDRYFIYQNWITWSKKRGRDLSSC